MAAERHLNTGSPISAADRLKATPSDAQLRFCRGLEKQTSAAAAARPVLLSLWSNSTYLEAVSVLWVDPKHLRTRHSFVSATERVEEHTHQTAKPALPFGAALDVAVEGFWLLLLLLLLLSAAFAAGGAAAGGAAAAWHCHKMGCALAV